MSEVFGREELERKPIEIPKGFFEKKNKRSALISVQCFYNIEIPEDMEFANEDEEAKWALKEFRKNQIVNTVEFNVGDKPFRHEGERTIDGRVKNFDMIQVDCVVNDGEVDKLLDAISKNKN